MIGKFAISKAGHDKDQLYVIIGVEDEFVYLCDGRLRPLHKPKKKRIKHIQIINQRLDASLCSRLVKQESVRDEEIKYAIKNYKKQDK